MKIGDKVSFLSETGGGIVAGFQGKYIVLVEDKDGFQIPMPISEVVVVENNDYSIGKVINKINRDTYSNKSIKAQLTEVESDIDNNTEDDFVDREVNFKKTPKERKGGNALACYLAFIPTNIDDVLTTHFKMYLINDCNYYFQYLLTTADDNLSTLYSQGEIISNTSLYLGEVGREELNKFKRIGFQLFAYKKDKTFILKPVIDLQLKLDLLKFCKLNSFKKSKYFDTPALIYTIVENDKVFTSFQLNASELKMNMYNNSSIINKQTNNLTKINNQSISKSNSRGEIVVDLHIDKIIDNKIGMSHVDILNYQLENLKIF